MIFKKFRFQEILKELEKSPLLNPLMPWGEWSVAHNEDPAESDDGPIYWIRPGEQVWICSSLGFILSVSCTVIGSAVSRIW